MTSGQCLWAGTHHPGTPVYEIVVGPDLPTAADFDSAPLAAPPLPRHFTCKDHERMIRDFMERQYRPRASSYREGRP